MKKSSNKLLSIFGIVVVLLMGYAFMRGLNVGVPTSETGTATNIVYTLVIIALGLLIPYGVLKLLFHAAHVSNPKEKELRARDLPKDKDDAGHALDQQYPPAR